jgi:hypothetical protein
MPSMRAEGKVTFTLQNYSADVRETAVAQYSKHSTNKTHNVLP